MYTRNQMFDKSSKASKLINYIYIESNCNIMAVTSKGRLYKINSVAEFDLMLANFDNTFLYSRDIFANIAKDWASMHPGE